eukprot:jgi/Ulvmu1/8876/UM049_0058.1
MPQHDEDCLLVETAPAVPGRARAAISVKEDIILVSDDDDCVEIPSAPTETTTLDCCNKAVSLQHVQRRLDSAGDGSSLVHASASLSCPACGDPLSWRDVCNIRPEFATVEDASELSCGTVVQATMRMLESTACAPAVDTLLQDPAALDLDPWHSARWLLEQLGLPELQAVLNCFGTAASADKAECIQRLRGCKQARPALRQAAVTAALLAVTFRLHLLVLGRLPEEHLAQRTSGHAKRSAAAAGPSSAAPLYSIVRFGPQGAAAGPQAKHHKTGPPDPHTTHLASGMHASTAGAAQQPHRVHSTAFGMNTAVRAAAMPAEQPAATWHGAMAARGQPAFYARPSAVTCAMRTAAQGHAGASQHAAAAAAPESTAAIAPGIAPKPTWAEYPDLRLQHTAKAAAAAHGVAKPARHAPPNCPAAGANMWRTSAANCSGVGYGGEHAVPPSTAAQRAQQAKTAAASTAAHAAEKVTCCAALLRLLQAAYTGPVVGMMPAALAVLRHGGVATVVHELMQDSLDAVLGDAAAQSALMQLIGHLCTWPDTLPLLSAPTSWPALLTPAAARSTSQLDDTAGGETIAARLARMRASCSLWEKKGQALLEASGDGDGDTADIGAVLLVADTADRVRDAVAIDTQTRKSLAAPAAQEAAAVGTPAAARAAPTRAVADGGAAEGAAPAAAAPAARAAHVAELKRLALLYDVPLLETHALRAEAQRHGIGGASGDKQRMKTIMKQVSSLATSLPAHWESSVHVAVDAERFDVLRALILPDSDTPYAFGAFIFDIFFPPSFPNAPPMVKFLTTGGGRVRFNPNLYDCGKVCLSLLGTWQGPSWNPATSTLLQVLVSLQAMVLCAHPYFNEPAHQTAAGSARGDAASATYNAKLADATAQHAILTPMCHPDKAPHSAFAEVLSRHWRAKAPELRARLAGPGGGQPASRHRDAICAALDQL